ncbi:GAF domain-containing protein [Pseudonocardia sp. 73-21]|uniref:GAF domain-containing protein n=1 Tax=Pseudonocardia sp. 73-21 TaxID=1895809 RepID=UPI00095F6F7E|nr:GAF domain-containing protein [Pseudonocardia sp. 73-21]OJY47539.1 MAG: transcriptional regulator [Pseudonocardia sp. 73-21]
MLDVVSVTDPPQRTRELARVRDAVLAGDLSDRAPREVVSASWRRSLAARVDPDHGDPPLIYEHAEITRVRDGHALAGVLPMLRETLVSIADEAMHMMIVTDAQGHILWREGQRDVLRTAGRVGLVEGTRWTEDSIGTNAMGTALAADRPVRIHSAEHLVRTYHQWTCAASPVHDPDTGAVIGAIDITGPARTFHPTTLALVVAAARLAEGHLAAQAAMRDERLLARNLPHLIGLRDEPGALLAPSGRVLAAQPLGWLPAHVELPTAGDRVALGEHGDGLLEPLAEGWLLRLQRRGARPRPALSLPFLGAERPIAILNGRPVRLSLRHAEILALLALHPEGFTADGLATALHGDAGKSVTVRAEVHRLRSVLDAGVLRTQPYRLQACVNADFLTVREALAGGRVLEAARAHRGPLLPRSEAPGVREERELMGGALRQAVLGGGDVEAMWALAETPDGADDVQLLERLLHALPDRDPRHAVLAARLDAAL